MGARIAATGLAIQHDSEASHSVLIVFGQYLNQRVAGSSPGRLTTRCNLPRLYDSQVISRGALSRRNSSPAQSKMSNSRPR